MKRDKEEKHAESTKGEKKKKGKNVVNEKLGENFCGKKKKICGESLSYRVFFFLIRLYN